MAGAFYTIRFFTSSIKDDETHTITREKTLNTGYSKIGDIVLYINFLKETIYRAIDTARSGEAFDLEITRGFYDSNGVQTGFDRWYHTGYLEDCSDGFYLPPDLEYTAEGSDLWLSLDDNYFADLLLQL